MNVLVLVLLFALAWPSPGAAQAGRTMSVAELAAYNKPDREKVLYEVKGKA